MPALLHAVLCVWLALPAAAAPRPKAVMLTTGGTIQMSGAAARSASRPAAALAPREQPLFERPLDSSVIGPERWKQAILGVERHAAAPGLPAVLTHGTDTLEQTGLVLSLVFDGRLKKPVVLTGSILPPDQPGSDARENLARARRVAEARGTPPLLYAVFGSEIHLASRVKKTRTSLEDGKPYFESVGGPVGRVTASGRVRFDPVFEAAAAGWRGLREEPSRIAFAPMEAAGPVFSLDPIKAAIKASILAGTKGRRGLLDLWRDLAGETMGTEKPLLRIPQAPPGVETLVATQDLSAASIRAAADRLGAGRGRAARDFTRRALERSHPVLAAIGQAVRAGIEVVVATNAYLSPTDLTLYEVGRMLALVGARDSGGKNLAELLAERPTKPRLVIVGTGDGHLPIGEASLEERLRRRR